MAFAETVGALLAKAIARYAKEKIVKWAREDARDRGEWRGRATWRKLSAAEKAAAGHDPNANMYRVKLDRIDPMRLYCPETGHEYRTDMEFDCDFGSIPEPFQEVSFDGSLKLDPLDFKASYGTHDNGYDKGGLWVRDPDRPGSDWVFVSMPRVQIDVVLLWGLSAEDANNATLQAVYRAVRAGGGFAWRKHRKADQA